MSKVLFISVHPDDETYGCGGAILKHKAKGDTIIWLNLTDISTSHPFGFTQQQVDTRKRTIELVKAKYGFNDFFNLAFPTILLDTIELNQLIKAIDEVIVSTQPDVIFLPNRSDVHSDHRIAFNAIFACTKNFRKPFIQKILMYETLSETEFAPALPESAFSPNYFVDVSDFFEQKLEILKLYDTEIMPDPLPRSIHAVKGLAAFRGSRIGVNYAEAFVSLLQIEKS